MNPRKGIDTSWSMLLFEVLPCRKGQILERGLKLVIICPVNHPGFLGPEGCNPRKGIETPLGLWRAM